MKLRDEVNFLLNELQELPLTDKEYYSAIEETTSYKDMLAVVLGNRHPLWKVNLRFKNKKKNKR